jgi:hypothetical protein
MALTRRRFLAAGAVAGAAVAAGGAAGRAGAQAARTWLLPRSAFNNLSNTSLGGDPAVCQSAFNNGTTWFSTVYQGAGPSTPSPIPGGYSGAGVLKFQAYQDGTVGLLDAISAGLPSWVDAVQYDSEHWAATPSVEQGAWLYNAQPNASYAHLFCQAAHREGLAVVLSPGNDLCNNSANPAYPGGAPQYPLESGEANYRAYVRHDLASAAKWLSAGDVYEYQAQVLELAPSTYHSVTAAVAGQVTAVKPGVTVLAGLGRTGATWDGATCAQLRAAAASVAGIAAGFWPNVDASASRVQPMICFLRSLV